MADYPKEVDIIFAGGGTAACVAAGRLAASNPGLEILLIERGPNNLNDQTVITPGLYSSHLVPSSKTALFWRGNKSNAMNDRELVVTTGGMLGGGSSINVMIYTQPSASDFDDWNTQGWTSSDLIPLLRKLETYHPTQGSPAHGYSGPMNISCPDHDTPIAQQYLDVCARRGIPQGKDIMDLKTGYGSARFPKWIDPTTKRRQDAAHCYIHNKADNESLKILTNTVVNRIVFDGIKATGVEVIANKEQDPNADQTPRTITARKLVVVSAGSIGSPIILQRSGIGMAERLAKLEINLVANLPDVGAHYQDHSNLIPAFYVSDDTETFDYLMKKEPGIKEQYRQQYKNGQGPLANNIVDAGSKLRPTAAELQAMGPPFNKVWKEYFELAPDKPVAIQMPICAFLGPPEANPDNARLAMICNISAYPTSRGHVYITSTDPYAPPDFETGILKEQADVDILIWTYKHSREIVRRMPNYRGDYPPFHPSFPKDSAAACVRLHGPPALDVEDLVYTPEDEVEIEKFIREKAGSNVHPIGTVRMKPREQGGCVDSQLNVYGTTNLKVADLSILPANVGATTYSTALLVGEKAAVLIAEDLGLNLP